MNDMIIKSLANDLNIPVKGIVSVLSLLKDGNTIPFIARYRKEATGGLNEVQIKDISDVYEYQINLLKRKEDVIRLIDEKGMLTEEIKNKILNCSKLVDIEDIYRPYKEKKKTKATDAIEKGLEPLAKIICSFPDDIETIISNFKTKEDLSVEDKVQGAKYIISEWISDNANYRKWIRNYTFNNGIIESKIKKNAKDESKVYEMYYSYSESIKNIKPHRVLALNRGEKEDILNVSININKEDIYLYLKRYLIKKDSNIYCTNIINDSIIDSYKRLIAPSIEREIRSELTDIANISSISNLKSNIYSLLMTPPMKEINVLGFDPAFRTGCKLAVLDKRGNVLDICVIYPHEPKNEVEKSKNKVLELINKYNIDVISIGNGTASRESEAFISNLIKENNLNTKYIITNEAGASVYSASKLAIKEFPSLDVSERSAISIGRRLQDPLSELVKIDPKSIGVGLYQHDLKQKELEESLTFTVSNVVNKVGVNINTSSKSILSYISGLTSKSIDLILETRDKLGKYTSRDQIKDIKGISKKVYEQAIGFIRINDAKNILDRTKIHPESYNITYKVLEYLDSSLEEIGTLNIKEKIEKIDINKLKDIISCDIYTLTDILESLKEPLLDPRDSLVAPILKSDILTIDNLEVGMKLQGVVRNVVDFGAFIDIGLKNDGLVHISQITNSYIKHPSDILSVGDIVDCYVLDILKDKNKVSLTMIKK